MRGLFCCVVFLLHGARQAVPFLFSSGVRWAECLLCLVLIARAGGRQAPVCQYAAGRPFSPGGQQEH